MHKYFTRATCCILAVLLLSCQHTPAKFHLEGFAQGTYYNIHYYDMQNRDLQDNIDSLLDEFDKTASLFVPTSLICKINKNEKDVIVNKDFKAMFDLAMEVSRQTDGDFDVTVGQLSRAYGFAAEKRIQLTDFELDSIKQCIGYQKVKIVNMQVIKDIDCLMLDFNAIAQGYVVDKIAAYFDSLQILDYLIDVGGEIIAKGQKTDGNWKVGIEQPSENQYSERQMAVAIPLINSALVTSGNYRKYFEKDGKRFGHTISPKTGQPAQNQLLSATIKCPKAALADAYATACMVMGVQKSKQFLEQHPQLDAYLIYIENDTLKTFLTKGFKELL
ncbi:MAG: FAD:protein FMN transferase [Bacteroidales bacterium]|nr:FAD:protein FMN transferase [Bacteroidales bacterium]